MSCACLQTPSGPLFPGQTVRSAEAGKLEHSARHERVTWRRAAGREMLAGDAEAKEEGSRCSRCYSSVRIHPVCAL